MIIFAAWRTAVPQFVSFPHSHLKSLNYLTMKTTRPKIALSAFIAMKNKIYAVIAVLAVMILASCKEEDVYGGSKPMSWEIESTSGAAEVSVKKEKANIYCGPNGGTVCLKTSSTNGPHFLPLATVLDSDAYEYDSSNHIISYKHEWCDVKIDGSLVSVNFRPYTTATEQELHIKVHDKSLFVGYGDLYIYRRP